MEDLLTVKQMANKLSVKYSTVYKWVSMGFVPYVKIGKCIRFDEKEIEKWLEKRKVKGRTRYKIEL